MIKKYNNYKDYTNKNCCINCENFCFWDGDYCCLQKLDIHQYGFGHSTWMDENIDRTMVLAKDCDKYLKWDIYLKSKENWFLEEYKKWKEWDKLCKQLEAHTKNK